MSDGKIQPSEIQALEKKLAGHPWAEDIKWSFDYEVKNDNAIDDLYKKVISYCEEHGPEPEYAFLIQTLEEVAYASGGIDTGEQQFIDNFTADLLKKFKEDIGRING
jgi:uncharacterized tellurite resistance protein B-like protein